MTAPAIPQTRSIGEFPRWVWALALLAAAAVMYIIFRGQFTLPHDDDAALFQWLNDLREWVDDNRNAAALVLGTIRFTVTFVVGVFMVALATLTWVGVIAFAAVLGYLVGGWRYGAMMASGFLSFGVLGLWEASIETLALTLGAVTLALAIGIPLGIVAGRNERFMRSITPVLDFMQIMPTFAYLAPLSLLFLIGTGTAGIATVIYAIAPAIRITALGIRGVSTTTVEAATSMGSTRRQLLTKVQLPMARRTIVLAINQTMMMALAMVVITALVDAPGLGQNIIRALQTTDVGSAFNAGLAIVIMAIMLDRLTTRASLRVDPSQAALQTDPPGRTRRVLMVGVPIVVAAIALGTVALGGNDFPDTVRFSFRDPVNAVTGFIETNLFVVTNAIKNVITELSINPLQTVLTTAPWWLILGILVGIAALAGGVRAAVTTALCLLAIAGLQLWQHSMETLASVLVATVLTLAVGLLIGIWSARSDRFATILRPFLDAAQTMPSFVYLLPAVALFGPTRFTGIVAALIYAVPPVIRLVDAGIRSVPSTVLEAATSNGSTARQLLWKVQLPMARPALLLAANQGIILVLAMVVVAGLVGAGALGYDVVAGFARRDFFGEGLAAGVAIVLLGVMLDRITQGAGTRQAVRRRVRISDPTSLGSARVAAGAG